MMLNMSSDWTRGEINVMPEMIGHFWIPDIIIHDLVRLSKHQARYNLYTAPFSFTKPTMLNEVAAMEILRDHSVYYKVR